jgi:flagellar L-ring protein FlgH
MLSSIPRWTTFLLMLAVQLVWTLPNAGAQNSSLFQNPVAELPPPPDGRGGQQPNLRAYSTLDTGSVMSASVPMLPQMAAASWTYQPPTQARALHVHDIISIRVDEAARMSAEGRASQRKNAMYDAVLKDWLAFDGFDSIKPAKQSDGDPAVNGQLNQTFRANSDVITRESLVFNIAAEIADIRPNGNVVLEAHKMISINDNRWEISLSGICQADDIGPDNVVLSRNVIDLKIDKRESGQSRDGYRRGWFTEFFSRFQPF